MMEELDTAWNDPQIVNPPIKVKEEIIRNRMKGYDVDGDMIGPNGIAGMDATDIPVGERHKIIEVSEKYRQMMFDETKRNFIQEYGVANGDTTRRSEVFESYQRSVRKKNRLKGSWTLGQYEQKYADALEAVVKEKLPDWSPGEPFDKEIFESLSREKIDAAIVSDGVELSLKVEQILKTK